MSIFYTTTKIPQARFELSFQNYRQKPYTTFLEKVDLYIRKLTQLVLHFPDFSMIFNGFSKFQPKAKTIFTARP
jgi:hypothetical protein